MAKTKSPTPVLSRHIHEAPLINIGAANPESVEAARRAVGDIIGSPCADAVKIAALEVLKGLAGAPQVSIESCHLSREPIAPGSAANS